MQPDTILAAFASEDTKRILRAVSDVMDLPDGAELAGLAQRIDEIRAVTAGIDLGGALVRNETHLAQALDRLTLYARRLNGEDRASTCYCALLPKAMFVMPKVLERRGRGVIEGETILREEYTTISDVTCTDCGARWQCREINGWHVPTYAWERVAAFSLS